MGRSVIEARHITNNQVTRTFLVQKHQFSDGFLGSFNDPALQIACLGLALTIIMMARKVNASILLGILATTLVGIARGIGH